MTAGMRRAVIVVSGNELLDGRVRDLNGAVAAADLSARGVKVMSMLVVADDKELLSRTLREALAGAPDLLLIGGGLGTTHDDLTAECLAAVLGVPLEEHPAALAMLEHSLAGIAERRGTSVPALLPQARRQALLPRGATPLAPAGVAPGISARQGVTRIFAFPGVPYEFRVMWGAVRDELAAEGFFPPVVSRVLRIVGSGEPPVAAVLARLPYDQLEVGINIGGGEVVVKLRHAPSATAAAQADAVVAALQRAVTVYSADGRTIDEMIAEALSARGETLAVAESCTGGSLGARITARPGSSDYFLGGVISYANEVKQELLCVPAGCLAQYGAVSGEVAAIMAEEARAVCRSTYGLSVTGVAGPGGGSPDKSFLFLLTSALTPESD